MFDMHEEKFVLLDINVQRDVFHPDGSLYSSGSGSAYRKILRLFGWAEMRGVPVISTVLLNRLGRRGPFGPIPHCIEGSEGELKMPGTYLSGSVNLGNSHTADLPDDILDKARQSIFETRDTDPFLHLKFDRLISEMPTGYHFIVCGAAVSRGIKQTVLGLRAHEQQVTVASDAVVSLDLPQTEMDWMKIAAKSVEMMDTSEIIKTYSALRRTHRQAAAS